jgi:hypothetical protein
MDKLGIVIDKLYVDHDNGMGHPESQERLLAIIDMLRHTKLWEEVVRIEPRDATKEEITLVHEPKYYDFVLSTKGRPRVFLDPARSRSTLHCAQPGECFRRSKACYGERLIPPFPLSDLPVITPKKTGLWVFVYSITWPSAQRTSLNRTSSIAY